MMIDKVRNELIQNVELKYKEFHEGIVPGKNDYLGVRIPVLREISKRIVLGNYNEIKKYIMTDSTYEDGNVYYLALEVDYETEMPKEDSMFFKQGDNNTLIPVTNEGDMDFLKTIFVNKFLNSVMQED